VGGTRRPEVDELGSGGWGKAGASAWGVVANRRLANAAATSEVWPGKRALDSTLLEMCRSRSAIAVLLRSDPFNASCALFARRIIVAAADCVSKSD
jgi:hypothetical protein